MKPEIRMKTTVDNNRAPVDGTPSYVSRAIVPRSAMERRGGHQATTGPTRSEGLPRRQGADVLRNTAPSHVSTPFIAGGGGVVPRHPPRVDGTEYL